MKVATFQKGSKVLELHKHTHRQCDDDNTCDVMLEVWACKVNGKEYPFVDEAAARMFLHHNLWTANVAA